MSAFSHIAFAAKSDIGRKRKNNEDSFGVFPSIGVFCVADGMGGGDDGEVASAATVKAIETFAKKFPLPEGKTYPVSGRIASIKAHLNNASAWIFNRAKEKRLKGCGSTFVGVCFDPSNPGEAVALHAGDSRLYRIRGRSIQQITKDHSAAELIGAKNESEVNPMFRGMILRAVGIQSSVEVEETVFSLREGDKILICSDGLSRMVPDKRIASIARAGKTLQDTVDALVAAANGAGGADNVTVELIEVGKLPAPLPVVEMPADAMSQNVPLAVGTPEPETQDTNRDSSASFEIIPSRNDDTLDTSESESKSTVTTMTVSEATESNSNRDIPASRASGNPAGAKRPFLKQALPLKSAAAAFVFLVISGVVTVGVIRNNADERKRVEARLQAEELGKKREEEERVARQLREAEIARQEKEAAERREAERKAEEARKQTEEELEKKREEEERVARKLREAEIARREKEAAERREAERKAEEARKQAEEELQKKREEERERIEKERIEMERKAREESIRLEQEKREAERKAAEKREAEEREREKKRIAAEKAAKELALQEEKRKAALKKAEEDRIKKKNERRNEALLAFEEACEQNVALAFIRKVSGIVGEAGVPDGIYRQFKDLSKQSTLSREEKLATAAKLTSEVKLIVANLEDYAKEYLRDAEEQLTDSLAKPEYRKSLEEVPRKVEEFLGHASAVVNGDPSDPEVQLECALIIHSVPKWL